MNYITNNKGSTTILIILIAGVIMTVGLGFNWLVREHIKASTGLKNKAEAILKARSAYDTLIYLMLNGQLATNEMIFSGVQDLTKLTSIPLNGKEVSLADDLYVKVQESNGLLSLININSQAIERLIKNVAQVENTSIPINSLLDWIDFSDVARINGAGKSYYREQQLPYQTRNYALQYKEEITFVRGIGRDIYTKIEKRIPHKRAMKKAVQGALDSGAKGVKIICGGRLGGAEIARRESYRVGSIPAQTLRANIDYGFAEALTTYGLIGIKTWIYKGDKVLDKVKEEVEEKK